MADAFHLQSRTAEPPPAPDEAHSRMYLPSEVQQSTPFATCPEVKARGEFGEIIGDSAVLKAALDLLSIVAPTDSSVLILGETGTGKELVAREVHRLSSRRGKSFVKIELRCDSCRAPGE